MSMTSKIPGEEFDPEKHQAIAMEEKEDTDKTIVVEDYQKGYYFYERVLRSAKVMNPRAVVIELGPAVNRI